MPNNLPSLKAPRQRPFNESRSQTMTEHWQDPDFRAKVAEGRGTTPDQSDPPPNVRVRDMTPAQLRAYWRRASAISLARKLSGMKPPLRHPANVTAGSALYGPHRGLVERSALFRLNVEASLDLIERLDNASVALGLPKHAITVQALEAELTRLTEQYNDGQDFPAPPPNYGLRRGYD